MQNIIRNSMVSFLLKKLLLLFLSLFLVMTLTFCIMKAIPGNPFVEDRAIPKEVLDTLYAHWGLDQSLFLQYLHYIKGFVTFDLGPSFIYQGRTVEQVIREGFPVSFTLGCEALALSLFFGSLLGSLAAFKKGKWQDGGSMFLSILGISFPNFLLATLLQYLLALKWGFFPIARWGSFAHTILPALSLAALPTAFIARLIRSGLVEVLEQDYVKMAYAKGLSTFRVIFFHGLRNALLPVISYLGAIFTNIITGSFIIEKIFGIPGLGQWLISSISNRDYTMILGLTVFFSSILIVTTFVVDILYGIIDPRVRICPQKH